MGRMYEALLGAGIQKIPGTITAVEGHERRITAALVAWARRHREPSSEGKRLLVGPSLSGGEVMLIPGVEPVSLPTEGRLLVLATIRNQRRELSMEPRPLAMVQCPTEIEGEPSLLITATVEQARTIKFRGLTGKVVSWQVFKGM